MNELAFGTEFLDHEPGVTHIGGGSLTWATLPLSAICGPPGAVVAD